MTMHCDFYNVYQRRMLKLADRIEQLKPYEFDVSRWLTPSGAPSCIASWAVAMFHSKPNEDMNIGHIAMTILGLDEEQGRKLFCPIWSDIHVATEPRDDPFVDDTARHAITKEWAAATLRHLAATGVVDWTFTRKAKPVAVYAKAQKTPRIPEYIPS